jgi:hypothetical protein
MALALRFSAARLRFARGRIDLVDSAGRRALIASPQIADARTGGTALPINRASDPRPPMLLKSQKSGSN